ncbi:tripartite tricarboxylate transporter substrate binding protein [uncultured Reyranella sp.]|uniref:Bug family tripartite tricarboxylate transporter substrate binding protein n=1 Tax=uncultured Reyranella sp. TaxID=735512 RepID=UPI0025FA28F6|nr:tripartite tricarboxylate transporter substrate binding protein [uncultured Reyranella sp.]
MKRRLFLAAAAAMVPATAVHAEAYPSKTIRVVLPGPPGGLLDVAARSLSEAMQRELGQTWLIDPRPGANGILAAQLVLGAPADGYTLYLTVSGHVVLNLLMRAPFDAMTDFRPIAMVGVSSALICVPPASPANTIAEFVALARANPGKLNYLNPGNGTSSHLIPEQLRMKYGIDITSISYKGLPPGVQDLLGNRLDLAIVSTTLAGPHVKAGRLKAIGVVGLKRAPDLPGVATMEEQGEGDLQVQSSIPILGQKGLPDAIVDRLNRAVNRALADPEVRARLANASIEPMPMTPGELDEAMRREHVRLGKLIRQLGITADGV